MEPRVRALVIPAVELVLEVERSGELPRGLEARLEEVVAARWASATGGNPNRVQDLWLT